MPSTRDFLRSIGLPPGDLTQLPDSEKRFLDGAQYRVEIPSTEGPRCLDAVLDEAERLGVRVHRVSQGSGVFLHLDDELDEMASRARRTRSRDSATVVYPAGTSRPRRSSARQDSQYPARDEASGGALVLVADKKTRGPVRRADHFRVGIPRRRVGGPWSRRRSSWPYDYTENPRLFAPSLKGNLAYLWQPRQLVALAVSHKPLSGPERSGPTRTRTTSCSV